MSAWIECALNGTWTRARQPRSPVTVAEIVEAGAAVAEGCLARGNPRADQPRGETGVTKRLRARISGA